MQFAVAIFRGYILLQDFKDCLYLSHDVLISPCVQDSGVQE